MLENTDRICSVLKIIDSIVNQGVIRNFLLLAVRKSEGIRLSSMFQREFAKLVIK